MSTLFNEDFREFQSNLERKIKLRRGPVDPSRRSFLRTIGLGAGVALIGCGGDNGGGPDPNDPLVERLTNDSIKSARPKVVVDSLGVVHMLYESPTGTGSNYEIMHTQNDGLGWSAPVKVSKDRAGDDETVSVATDALGNLHSVWNNRATKQVLYSGYNGTSWSPAQVVYTSINDINLNPSVAINPDNNFPHITLNEFESGIGNGIWEVYFDGAVWTPAEKISEDSIDSLYHSLAFDSDGNRFNVWEGWDGAVLQTCYAQHNGSVWQTPAIVPNLSARDRFGPRIAADDLGKVHALVSEDVAGNREIQYFAFDILASLWSSPENVSKMTGMSRFPAISVDENGVPCGAWEEGDGGDGTGVYFSKRSSGVWTPARIVSQDVDMSAYPSVAVGPAQIYTGFVKGDASDESTYEVMCETAQR